MNAWAILRSELERYRAWAAEHPSPFADPDPEAVEAVYAARSTGSRQGAVAVVPVLGPIMKRDTILTMIFGGTSTNRLVAQMRQLAADESVGRILLNVDSPGGTMSGLTELAAEIRRVRDVKPVTAIANDMMASAAYWIGSQASEIVATPEALVGSIGVRMEHWDLSAADEMMGLKVTHIAMPPEKAEGNIDEPLTDGARAEMEALVKQGYDLFVADIARGRGITARDRTAC